jgi:5'-nucleotidase
LLFSLPILQTFLLQQCFGNHEFDLGVETLAKFLNNVTFPVVSANTDVTNEPRLAGKFSKSWTTNEGGEEIGVVGYLTTETAQISSGGKLCKTLLRENN